jgi:hypothetical protein
MSLLKREKIDGIDCRLPWVSQTPSLTQESDKKKMQQAVLSSSPEASQAFSLVATMTTCE